MRPSPGSTCREVPLHELLVNILGGILATLMISTIAVIGGSNGTKEISQIVGSVLLHRRNQLLVTATIVLLIFKILQKIAPTPCNDDQKNKNNRSKGTTSSQNAQKKSVSIRIALEGDQEDPSVDNNEEDNTKSLRHKAENAIHITVFL